MFRKNLTESYRNEIKYHNPTTLREAVNIAIDFDKIYGSNANKEVNVLEHRNKTKNSKEFKRNFKSGNKWCTECKRKGNHAYENCWKAHPELRPKRKNQDGKYNPKTTKKTPPSFNHENSNKNSSKTNWTNRR